MILYSAQTGLFYDSEVSAFLPVDAVELTDDEHMRLLDGQSMGKVICPDVSGRPILMDPPPLTYDELATLALKHRDYLLGVATIRTSPLQDAADIDDASEEEGKMLVLWKRYRIALNRIHMQSGFPVSVEWPTPPLDIGL